VALADVADEASANSAAQAIAANRADQYLAEWMPGILCSP
jgi:hypothetical protein